MTLRSAPAVILVRPQMGENIGAVARAMSNFGLSELRIAAPRDGWPNRKAQEMAAGAEHIIAGARVFADFPAALEGIEQAFATTARMRDLEKRVVDPQGAAISIHQCTAQGLRAALVFGPERTGLENDDIVWCDTLVTIPTSGENSSLNLAQSMVILGYEWWRARPEHVPPPGRNAPSPAPKEDWKRLFDQLEQYLDQSNFFRVPEKKTVMWQNLKTMLQRGGFSDQEVRTLRGVLRCIWERRRDSSLS